MSSTRLARSDPKAPTRRTDDTRPRRAGVGSAVVRDWIAVTGLRRFDPAATHTALPQSVMSDPGLSLEAKGLYALLASFQGQPVDPFIDAIEDNEVVAGAIEELISAGLAVRVARD